MIATQSEPMRLKLTNAVINKHLPPPTNGQRQALLYDTEISGFGVYRNATGPARYFVHYRVGNRQRKKMIGLVTEISLTEARAEAGALKVAARLGRDVLRERKEESERGITLQTAYEAYLEALRRKGATERTIENYEQH